MFRNAHAIVLKQKPFWIMSGCDLDEVEEVYAGSFYRNKSHNCLQHV